MKRGSPRSATVVLVATVSLVVAPGCTGEGDVAVIVRGISSSGARDAVEVQSRDRAQTFLRRIDGDVQEVLRAELGRGEPEWIALTGVVSGADQASILRLAADGRLLARHRVGGRSPWGTQLQVPRAKSAFAARVDGEPCLVVTTSGNWGQSSIEVISAGADGRLAPRLRFWNYGAIETVAIAGKLVGFVGLHNGLRRGAAQDYPVVAGAFELSPSRTPPAGPTELRGWVPARDGTPEDRGVGYRRYFVLPETHGLTTSRILPLEIEGRKLRVRLDSGLDYLLGVDDGSVELTASPEFRDDYERRRVSGEPDATTYVKNLGAQVRAMALE